MALQENNINSELCKLDLQQRSKDEDFSNAVLLIPNCRIYFILLFSGVDIMTFLGWEDLLWVEQEDVFLLSVFFLYSYGLLKAFSYNEDEYNVDKV
jgi:hypothetical protein